MKFYSNFFLGKKGIEFSSKYIILFILLLFVLFFVGNQSFSLIDLSSSGISSLEEQQCEQEKEIGIYLNPYINCDENECADEEKINWEDAKKYLGKKDCDNLKKNEEGVEEDKACTCVQNVIWIVKESGESGLIINSNSINFKETQSDKVISFPEIQKLIENYDNKIISFSQDNDINKDKLKAFLIVESSGKPFDGNHPTVRFECLKFNKNVPDSKKVSCNTDKYIYGNKEDTDKEAFLKAFKIDEEEAILQSSFGLGQIMGSNYKAAGFNSPEEFYESMFNEEKQIDAFFNFVLSNTKLVSELKKENTNWETVASIYNGNGYKNNNYDVKLKETYESLIS